jgi:DNA-binding NarL/FixJ family response regulator
MIISAGASGYVPKKCAAQELVDAVRAVVSGGTYLSPEIAGSLMDDSKKLRVDNLADRVKYAIREGIT